jgi:hypothetical protein
LQSPWLIHYWPFTSHIQDVVGGAKMFNGYKAGLRPDRHGRPISAITLNTGFYKMPSINYFPTGEFTITIWLNLRSNNDWSRVIEFCNQPTSDDSISLIAYAPDTQRPKLVIRNNGIEDKIENKTLALVLNTWNHLAISYSNQNVTFYLNASLLESIPITGQLKNMTRLYNAIGGSCNQTTTPGVQYLNGTVDEVKIFNKALNKKEIELEMNNLSN